MMITTENQIELGLIAKLGDLKYTYRPDICDRATLEANFREQFQQLNRVSLTDEEFARLDPAATIKESLTVQTGGACEVHRSARGQAPLEYDQKHWRPCHG